MKSNPFKYAAILIIIAGVAWATMPKTWGTRERLTSTDLNANFAHAEASFRGGTHTLITNPDISGSAAIAHTKLAVPALMPKLWATVGPGACGSTPCTVAASGGTGITVTRTSVGNYSFNFAARTNADYGIWVTSRTANVFCYVGALTTTAAAFTCANTTPAAAEAAFSILLMDNDN